MVEGVKSKGKRKGRGKREKGRGKRKEERKRKKKVSKRDKRKPPRAGGGFVVCGVGGKVVQIIILYPKFFEISNNCLHLNNHRIFR